MSPGSLLLMLALPAAPQPLWSTPSSLSRSCLASTNSMMLAGSCMSRRAAYAEHASDAGCRGIQPHAGGGRAAAARAPTQRGERRVPHQRQHGGDQRGRPRLAGRRLVAARAAGADPARVSSGAAHGLQRWPPASPAGRAGGSAA